LKIIVHARNSKIHNPFGNKALIIQSNILNPNGEKPMCEFNVIFNGKTQFKDVVYAKTENNNVTVKNILGETREFKNCGITEVDVNSTRLVLTAIKH
jgi:predicted RNA-binding protein